MWDIPKLLNCPDKLLPFVTEFNNYRYFLLEGGRGGGKSQVVARYLLYVADLVPDLRIVCGREVQLRIEESVHAILAGFIKNENLNFEVLANKIRHKENGSTFSFRGFKENGVTGARGMEGTHILWVDEAQQLEKQTVDDVVPTIIRREKAKIIFTMNRYMMDDAAYEFMAGNPECLHISINYYENPFCDLGLKNLAELCRNKSQRDYKYIWLGQPLASADDYLFNYEKLHNAFTIEPYGDLFYKQRVMGIDFAAQGNDQCVATVLDRLTNQHWQLTERSAWDEPDTTVSIGKIVHLIGLHKPDVTMLDIGGMGKPVYDRLIELGIKNLMPFDGASTAGVDTTYAANVRADAYLTLMQWFDQGFLKIERKDAEVVKQLEKIRFKYRSNGSKIIQPKVDMKKELRYSPDDADSLNMAVYGAVKYLGKLANSQTAGNVVTRKYGSNRKR